MEDTLVPIFAIMFLFGGPIAAIIIWRILAHQERMEMLRRGITPPMDPRAMRRAMKYGWQPGPSQNPIPGPMPNMNMGMNSNPYGYDQSFYAQQQLRKGMQVAFVGMALLIGLSFIGYRGDGPPHYGPWLLGGLIPLFVGIAQIITAVMGGARIGGSPAGIGTTQNFGPPPGVSAPPPGPSAAQAPTGPTYGGWRPGNIPEIEKPASPPDYR